MSERVRVTHVGNAPNGDGGISSVIRNSLRLDDFDSQCLVSFRDGARAWSVGPTLRTLWRLMSARRQNLGVVQVHLSQKGSYVREGMALLGARARGLPVVATLHGSRTAEFLSRSPWAVNVLKRAHVVTVLGDATAMVVGRLLPSKQVVPVSNFVDIPEELAPRTAPIVLFAGVVGRRKGIDVLMDSWSVVRRERPDARLRIAGPFADGPDAIAGLPEAIGAQLGIEYVGSLTPAEVSNELRRARVAVLPSRAEGMPMFLLEAMAASCAVVSTRVGDIPQLVEDTGILVSPSDCPALADALLRLLQDDEMSAALAAAGHRRVCDSFGPTAAASQLRHVYETAVEEAS